MWALPRPVIKRAAIGTAVGLSPYLVQVITAGPVTTFRGMIVDPIVHLRAARHLPVPPDPDHLVGVARVIAAVDRSWPLPRFTPAQQLFVWFVLLAVVAVALAGFAVWRVRRDQNGIRPRVLLAGSLFGARHVPAGGATSRLRAPRVGERHRDHPRARGDGRAHHGRPAHVEDRVGRIRDGSGRDRRRSRCCSRATPRAAT